MYEHNPILGDRAGQPIADCYGLIARGNAAALALADGVNWGSYLKNIKFTLLLILILQCLFLFILGNGAKLAACSAINGCLTYLNKAIFGLRQGTCILNTGSF